MDALRWLSVGVALALVGGCAEDSGGPDGVFAPRCGSDEPVRMLDIEAGMRVSQSQQVGDRVYHSIRTEQQSDVPTTLVSTGLCGESPREIQAGAGFVFTSPNWPGVVFDHAADDPSTIVVLDADGLAPPRPFMTGLADRFGWTDWRAYGIAELRRDETTDTSTLQVIPDPARIDAGPTSPQVIAEGLRDAYKEGDAVWAIDADDSLVRISLPSGAREEIATGVATMRTDSHAPWSVVFEGPADQDPSMPAPAQLLDRSTGELTELPDLVPEQVLLDRGYIRIDVDHRTRRLLELPGLAETAIETPVSLMFRLADGRWVDMLDDIAIFDPATGGRLVVMSGGGIVSISSNDVWLAPGAGAPALVVDHGTPLYHVDLAAGRFSVAARHVVYGTHHPLDDGRLLGLQDVEDGFGNLVVIEPDTLATEVLVEGAGRGSANRGWFDDHDVIAYDTRDADGHGILWAAKLPPR